jgi:hypothetical protein
MVFTVRVRLGGEGPTRRAVLVSAAAGLTAAGLGGCDFGKAGSEPTPPPDVLLPFLAATVALADTYDAAIEALPALSARLTPLRDDHRAHVRALEKEIGVPRPSAAPSAAQAPTLESLVTAERAAQQEAEKTCLEGPSYRAALLGSIAACRASHQAALR